MSFFLMREEGKMNLSNNNPTVNQNIRALQQLASQVDESGAKVRKSLSSIWGRFAIWLESKRGKIPKWAAKHIEMHNQLKKAVNEMKAKGEEDKIPTDVVKTLKESKAVVGKLANKVKYSAFLKSFLQETASVDQHGLLTGEKGVKLKKSETEWHLNLGLLMNVHSRTKDSAMKKQIEFLALNYLAKAAPANIFATGLDSETTAKLEDMFQFGLMREAFSYHRESPVFERYMTQAIDDAFAKESRGQFWLTDTTNFEELLPMLFNVVDTPKVANVSDLVDGWSDGFANALTEHLENKPEDSLFNFIDPPLLFDLTPLLDAIIKTDGDAEKEQIFADKKQEIEQAFEKAVDKAIDKLKQKKPALVKTPDDEQKIRVYLKANVSCICRIELKAGDEKEGIGVLKNIGFFVDSDHYKLPESMFISGKEVSFLNWKMKGKTSDRFAKNILSDKDPKQRKDFVDFVNLTGIRIGGVRGREKVFNFMSMKEFFEKMELHYSQIEYAVHGKNVEAFTEKDKIANTKLFKRLKSNMEDPKLSENKPHITILGKATVGLLEGLMDEISEEKWKDLNENPDTRMILQQSLFRIMQHLAAAENHTDDFTQFSQAIELAHCEMATILSLASPFKEGDFQKIYKAKLTIVPENLRKNLKVGVNKSAMNTFAGINAAVQKLNSKPEKVYGENSYFEAVAFIGDNRSTCDVVGNKDINSVDLYAGEFNHNVNISMDHDHYLAGAVINDVELLLKEKVDTKHLTVAIDVTIDFVNSPKAEELLKHFSKEIEDGKLNFVFFRSGQKFDMLGMDNYYGAPFWMVNNGGDQWKGFDKLTTSDAYKTDPVSVQWFCLVNKYASQALDDYRRQIFKNARTILDDVPDELKPGASTDQQIRISTVADDMEPAFIDIKILNDLPAITENRLEKLLLAKFAEKGLKIHSKASFGFYHPNINVINSKEDRTPRNFRINPGLNAEENQIIIDFLKEIPKLLNQIDKKKKAGEFPRWFFPPH